MGGKGRKRRSNFFAQTVWTALHYEPLETCGRSKAGDEQDLASAALSQPTPPQPCPLEKRRGQPSSPLSKLGGLGAAWQGNFDRQPGDPAPRNRAGLPRRCRPALTGTSLSTSFGGGRAGNASSGDRGGRRALSPCSLYQGGSSGGPAAGDRGRTCWGREAHLPLPVTEVRRGGACGHRRWAARSVASGVPHGE